MRLSRPFLPIVAAAVALSWAAADLAAASVGASATPRSTASADGRVSAVVEVGGVTYIGGSFTRVRRPDGTSVSRDRLAAIDTATGDVTGWDPGANGDVLALAAADGKIIAGGDFTRVGGKSRARLAKIYTADGRVSSWNPGASSTVRALAVKGSKVFAGGTFSTLGGKVVDGLASVSVSSGSVSSTFKPRPNGGVRSLALAHDGTRLYVGGNFTVIGGSSRRHLAAVSTSSGSARSWAPNPDWVVFSVAAGADGQRVYAGGAGTGGRVAAYKVSSAAEVWNRRLDGDANTVVVTAGDVYAGGHFHVADDQPREKLAAFDPATGTLDPWNPGADSITGVYALWAGSANLWVGGDFDDIGGRRQPRIAAFAGMP